MSLPVYESNATPEQREQKIKFMYFQLKMIKEQSGWKRPADETVVKCGCHKKIKLIYAYRCRYCGIWYCGDCADEHFGYKKVDESVEIPTNGGVK
jgi:hypothetical protein